MSDKLRDADGRWATVVIVSPNDADGDRVPRELLQRLLEPAARRLARAFGLEHRFYYLNYGANASVQLVLAAGALGPERRARLVLALGRCASRWERRGGASKSVHGFMNIERGVAGFGGSGGLAAVEALESAASSAIVDVLRRCGTILRMPKRTAFALCLADAILDAALRSTAEKLRATLLWQAAYAALLKRDGFPPPELPAGRPATTPAQALESLEDWQKELLSGLQSALRAPGAALRAAVLSGDAAFPLLSEVAWRRVVHQNWGRLGLTPFEETVLLDWLCAMYGPHG